MLSSGGVAGVGCATATAMTSAWEGLSQMHQASCQSSATLPAPIAGWTSRPAADASHVLHISSRGAQRVVQSMESAVQCIKWASISI